MRSVSDYPAAPNINVEGYEKKYSKKGFLRKVLDVALKAGRGLVEKGYTLYFSAKDQDTPKWARTVVFGSLGYFISPLDAVPDFLPGVGFTDDMIVVAAAVAVISAYIKPIHKKMAKEKADGFFGVEPFEANEPNVPKRLYEQV